jgi:hypothetical protein
VTSGIGPEISTSQMIDTIAGEPTFTKKMNVFILLCRNGHESMGFTPEP